MYVAYRKNNMPQHDKSVFVLYILFCILLIQLAAIYPRTQSKEKNVCYISSFLAFQQFLCPYLINYLNTPLIYMYRRLTRYCSSKREKKVFKIIHEVLSSFTIILLMKRELVAFLKLIVLLLSFMFLCFVSLPCVP